MLANLAVVAQIKGFVGVKGGAHLSNAYIEHTIYNTFMSTTFIPGYQVGVTSKFFTSRAKVGLQMGMGLETKGWKQTFETDEPSYTVRLNYLTFPVEAVGYVGKGKTKFFYTLGMYLESFMSVKKDPTPDLTNLGNAVEFYSYEEDRDRKFGYGVRASIGLQRQFPFGAIHLDSFVTYSVSSFIRSEDLSNRLPDLTNHYAAGFCMAYLIPFGKKDF